MKSVSVRIAVFVYLAVCAAVAQASAAECPAYLPAGVVIRVLPDEKLTAGSSSGPTILTVSSDVRFFPNRPPLLLRGTKVLGTILESKQAGRFHGKARLRITLRSILTSDLCEYPIDARIVEAGRHKVEDDVVWGGTHSSDVVALFVSAYNHLSVVATSRPGAEAHAGSRNAAQHQAPRALIARRNVWPAERKRCGRSFARQDRTGRARFFTNPCGFGAAGVTTSGTTKHSRGFGTMFHRPV